MTTIKDYSDFNSAVNKVFFDGRYKFNPVYLDLEDEKKNEISELLGLRSVNFDHALGKAVEETLSWHTGDIYSWHFQNLKKWQSSKFSGEPPFSALLLSFSLAAEHMRKGDSFSSTNYYRRLSEVFGKEDEATNTKLSASGKKTEIFWKALNYWLMENDSLFGRPTAKQISKHKYVSYSLSQSLVRDADRKNLQKMFVHFNLSPLEHLNEFEVEQYLHQWIPTSEPSAWLKKLWASPELRERVILSAINELEDWEGNLEAADNKSAPTVKLNWALVKRNFPRAKLKLTLVTAMEEEFFEDSELSLCSSNLTNIAKQAFNGAEKLWLTHDAGTRFAYLDSTIDINLNALLLSAFELEHVSKLRKFKCEARPIIPFVKIQGSPIYQEVNKVSLFTNHMILCHHNWAEKVEPILLESARKGFSCVKSCDLDGLPDKWVLFENVEFVSVPEDIHNDLQVLVPLSEGFNIKIRDGLKLASGIWHTDALPKIYASDEYGFLDVEVNNNTFSNSRETLYSQPSTLYNPDFLNQISTILEGKNLTIVARKNNKTYDKDISFRSASTPRGLLSSKGQLLTYSLDKRGGFDLYSASNCEQLTNDDCFLQGMLYMGQAHTIVETPKLGQSNYLKANFEELGSWKGYILDGAVDDSTSCIVRGYHYWLCADDSKSMKCQGCNSFVIVKGKKTKPKIINTNKSIAISTEKNYQISSIHDEKNRKIPFDVVYDAICYLGAGSWSQLQSILCEAVDGPSDVHIANQNLIDLGFLDQTVSGSARPKLWSCPPPVLVVTNDSSVYLSGFRNKKLIENVRNTFEKYNFIYQHLQSEDNLSPSTHTWEIGSANLDEIKKSLEYFKDSHGRSIKIQHAPASTIMHYLPYISDYQLSLPNIHIGKIKEIEKFDLETGKWRRGAFDGPGAYRTRFAGIRYFYHRGGVTNEAAYETVKLLHAKDSKVFLHNYNEINHTFECLVGCPPPGLYRRALVSCSGRLPITANRKTIYEGISKEVGKLLMYKLYK